MSVALNDSIAFLGCHTTPDAIGLTYAEGPIQAAALDRASCTNSFRGRFMHAFLGPAGFLGEEERFRVDTAAGGGGLPVPVVGDCGRQGRRENQEWHPFGAGVRRTRAKTARAGP
jgi:hypothetical protein